MSAKVVPGAVAAMRTMGRLTMLRLVRGRALWVSLLIAFVPVAYAAAVRGGRGGIAIGAELFTFELLVASVLAPMFVGASIGEDIEDKTSTYLWSRPLPRWAVFAGKLVALVPITTAVVLASWTAASWLAWHRVPAPVTFASLALATTATSLVSAGIASLAPKHGMALTIVYMLFFDAPLGVMPATLREISIGYQARALIDPTLGATGPVVALAAIASVWSLIAFLRVRRLEA